MSARGYLLDTQVFVWSITRPTKLARHTRERLDEGPMYLSAITAWELGLKSYAGKPLLPAGLDPVEAALDFGAQWIAIEPRHAHAAAMLGGLHGDPADRLLVATAREENLVFVTRDATILELAPRLLGPLLLEA